MLPHRRDDREEDDEQPEYAGTPIHESLPQSVKEVWARKKRRADSVKHANQMWAPILEDYREYAEKLVFVPWRDT